MKRKGQPPTSPSPGALFTPVHVESITVSLTVSIFAPSSPFPTERFEYGLGRLQQLGWDVRTPSSIRAKHGFLAGEDAHRFESFRRDWLDPSVDVMFAARGGYGAHRILPELETLGPSPNRKRVVGFSDITAIHAWLFRRGHPSVHGPVVTQLGDLSAVDLERLRRVLEGPWPGLTYTADGPALASGQARGKIFGGCLAVITPLLGTPYAPDFRDTILVLEDVAEPPFRVDRMLTHLRLAGVLSQVAGIAVGDFVGGKAVREGEPDVAAVLRERLSDLGIPVVTGLPIGHGTRNLALPLGAQARLDADNGELVIEDDGWPTR